ncbi:MAG: FMN-binding glutamate synthase family protein, partial [Parvibaculales bacterium]
TTIAFGSTRSLRIPGEFYFVNCPFPTLDDQMTKTASIVLGEGTKHPYKTASLFNISGMSFGAISKPAILALSNGARMAGCWMNTGEGGLSTYHLEGGADIIFQIGTAKYGVRKKDGSLDDKKLKKIADHKQVKMFEVKLSQGAKPGKGGILPGGKVTKEIAETRGIEIGEDSISPNRHPEIDNISEILDFVNHVRKVTGKPTGFKAVVGAYGWLDSLFTEINKRGIETAPDFITIDGADGGTGAAPAALMDYVGLPLSESLPMLVDKLHEYKLHPRIRIIASGKLITPADVAWAYSAGADFVNSARGFMFALGCIQALQCNKNTCPTGITTHDKRLQRGLNPKNKAERVRKYATRITEEVEVIAHSCGASDPRKLRRYHVRIVTENTRSVSMSDIWPELRAKG